MWLCRALATCAAAGALAAASVATAASGPGQPVPFGRLAGQSIMTGMSGRTPSAGLLARIRAGHVGGVIFFADNIGSPSGLTRLVAELQAAAAAGGNPPLLIALDQEGGGVKRLPAGPPGLSPAAMGRDGHAARARSEGDATAAYLRRLGVDVDLAPVLDTPSLPTSFLGSRAFSSDRLVNAELGTAFLQGLQGGGVAATAKHFPGLGFAPGTTDTKAVVLRTPARALDAGLLPFRRAIGAGLKLVMVSNAGYAAYDGSGTPAVLSRPIVTGLLRGQLGFRGVVISDAMEAPGPSSRAGSPVTAIAAGVDVLLYTSERDSSRAYAELVAAGKSGKLSRGELASSASRIAALKRWLAG